MPDLLLSSPTHLEMKPPVIPAMMSIIVVLAGVEVLKETKHRVWVVVFEFNDFFVLLLVTLVSARTYHLPVENQVMHL